MFNRTIFVERNATKQANRQIDRQTDRESQTQEDQIAPTQWAQARINEKTSK